MAALTQKVVTHFGVVDQVVGNSQIVQTQNLAEVGLLRALAPVGDPSVPVCAPLGRVGVIPESCEFFLDGGEEGGGLIELGQRAKVFIEVSRPRSTDGQGVNPRVPQAEEGVEFHRAQRGGGLGQFGGRLVEHSALVIWANDKDAHIVLFCRGERGGMLLKNKVPVQVDVIEAPTLAQLFDQFG